MSYGGLGVPDWSNMEPINSLSAIDRSDSPENLFVGCWEKKKKKSQSDSGIIEFSEPDFYSNVTPEVAERVLLSGRCVR